MRGITFQFLSGLLAGLLAAGVLLVAARRPPGHPVELLPPPTPLPVRVYITGAVRAPGVYALTRGAIWQDALAQAGGALPQAQLAALNLAQPARDGDHIEVPLAATATPTRAPATATRPPTATAPHVTPAPGEPTTAASATPAEAEVAARVSGGLININTAGISEFDSLPGIGPSIAQRILDYRAEHGAFQQLEDLMNVKGIGPATFDKIKDQITLGS